MTHRITASLIVGSAPTTLTATGAMAHAVPEIGQARTAIGQTAPALVGMGRAAATPVAATPAASGVQVASCPMDFKGTLSRGNASTNTSINRSSNGSRNSSSNTSSHRCSAVTRSRMQARTVRRIPAAARPTGVGVAGGAARARHWSGCCWHAPCSPVSRAPAAFMSHRGSPCRIAPLETSACYRHLDIRLQNQTCHAC
jgi:hypothetical protein